MRTELQKKAFAEGYIEKTSQEYPRISTGDYPGGEIGVTNSSGRNQGGYEQGNNPWRQAVMALIKAFSSGNWGGGTNRTSKDRYATKNWLDPNKTFDNKYEKDQVIDRFMEDAFRKPARKKWKAMGWSPEEYNQMRWDQEQGKAPPFMNPMPKDEYEKQKRYRRNVPMGKNPNHLVAWKNDTGSFDDSDSEQFEM